MGFVLSEAEQNYHYGDQLTHFGVKGMKWGKSRAGTALEAKRNQGKSGSSDGAGKPKPTSKEIWAARERQSARAGKLVVADRDFQIAKTQKGKSAALKVINEMAKDLNTGDDAFIASRKTGAEKVSEVILGVAGAVFVATLVASKVR